MLSKITILLLLIPSSFSLAHQTESEVTLKPISVCEIFAAPQSFRGKKVAVIGRLGTTMEGWWLSEESCEQQRKVDNYVGPYIIWLKYDSSAPSAFSGDMPIDMNFSNKKLVEIIKTTKLRSDHDAWVIVYGQLEAKKKLKRGGNGYGHLGAAPIQLVYRQMDIKILSEEEVKVLQR